MVAAGPDDATLFDDPDTGGRSKLRLEIAYDGTEFRGFAAQPDVRTVEGVLGKALEKALRHAVDLTCAGRTDAGVHAWGQVVSLEADPGVDPWQLKGALNRMLAPEIVVRSCELADPEFDARHSARSRSYRYTIVNRPEPDAFLARHAWWVAQPLDLNALRLGVDPFIGEHDFASFCRKGPAGSTTIRNVRESRWVDLGEGVHRYEIKATAFCWQMVRSIVGTLVDVGSGKIRPGDLRGIIGACDRETAGRVAPPHGLCLWEVEY